MDFLDDFDAEDAALLGGLFGMVEEETEERRRKRKLLKEFEVTDLDESELDEAFDHQGQHYDYDDD